MERFFGRLEEALLALGRFVRSREGGDQAWEEARKEFFLAPGKFEEGAPREGRFLEWFCLERGREGEASLLSLFLRAGMPGLAGGRPAWLEEALAGSRFGLFRVQEREGRRLVLSFPSGRTFRLYWPLRSRETPSRGDTLLGRVYPFGGTGEKDLFFPSPWMILYQGGDLVSALERDMAAARALGRRGRLGQKELETILEGGLAGAEKEGEHPLGPELSLPDLVDRIQILFDRFGFVGVTAAEVAREAREASSFAEAFGEFLDQLAFETDVDLEEIRRLFLQLWQRLRDPREGEREGGEAARERGSVAARPWADPEAPCPCGSGLPYEACHMGRDLVARLEEAEGKEEKLGPILEGLGRALGGLGDDRGEDPISAREEGMVEARALVLEYLWEKGLDPKGPEGEALESYLDHLGKRLNSLPPLRAEDLVGDPAKEWILSQFLALGKDRKEQEAFLAGPARVLLAFGAWLLAAHGLEKAGERKEDLEKTYLPAFERAARVTFEGALGGMKGGMGEEAREQALFHVVQEKEGAGLFLARGFPPGEGGEGGDRLEGEWDLPPGLQEGDLVVGSLGPGDRLLPPFQVIPAVAVPFLRG